MSCSDISGELTGKVAEVITMPGEASLEVRLRTSNRSETVRLAPMRFLSGKDALPREGQTIAIKGFRVAGSDSPFVVATSLQIDGRVVQLRDSRGRPLW
jgi:hypothetical protein